MDISIFDLDHDGTPEIYGKFQQKMMNAGDEGWFFLNYAWVWLSYTENKPNAILSLTAQERSDSWGSGYDLIGTVDIDGDHIDEVIVKGSGYEVVWFEIYEYKGGRLNKVFRGAEYGC